MSFLDQMGGLLQQYAGGSAQPDPAQAAGHFDQVARQAPQSSLAGALTQVFQSPETGTFGQNISSMFGQSNADQRAGILNKLLPYVGAGTLGSLGSLLGPGVLSGMGSGAGTSPRITPEMAQQVPPEAVEQLANHAQQQNPSVVEQASSFYAQHPTLVKALGAGAAIMALRHLAAAEQR